MLAAWRSSKTASDKSQSPAVASDAAPSPAPIRTRRLSLPARLQPVATLFNANASPAANGERKEHNHRRLLKRRRSIDKAQKAAVEILSCILCADAAPSKLKHQLTEPEKARRIVGQLKAMDVPVTDAEDGQNFDQPCQHSHTKALCLKDPFELEIIDSEPLEKIPEDAELVPEKRMKRTSFGVSNVVNFATQIPSPGGILGQAIGGSGALDVLATASGNLLSHANDPSPPLDRMSLFVYWFGYEIACPSASMQHLQSAHSISSTVFAFLQAMTASGAPELTPFVRYLSMYFDMEWKAIQAQDRGRGVVLAATFVLPFAPIPRPWDFPPPLTVEEFQT